LVEELADFVLHVAQANSSAVGPRTDGRPAVVIGFDGPAEVGTSALADDVAGALISTGLLVVRASTQWWWRPSALRLELGHRNVDMLLAGWVDADAIRRELIDPLASGRPYITRLRDSRTGRPVRENRKPVRPGAVLLLDGPFLLAAVLPLDAVVLVNTSAAALSRALPAHSAWWSEAFEVYQREYQPVQHADVVLSYDHPATPAAAGLDPGRVKNIPT